MTWGVRDLRAVHMRVSAARGAAGIRDSGAGAAARPWLLMSTAGGMSGALLSFRLSFEQYLPSPCFTTPAHCQPAPPSLHADGSGLPPCDGCRSAPTCDICCRVGSGALQQYGDCTLRKVVDQARWWAALGVCALCSIKGEVDAEALSVKLLTRLADKKHRGNASGGWHKACRDKVVCWKLKAKAAAAARLEVRTCSPRAVPQPRQCPSPAQRVATFPAPSPLTAPPTPAHPPNTIVTYSIARRGLDVHVQRAWRACRLACLDQHSSPIPTVFWLAHLRRTGSPMPRLSPARLVQGTGVVVPGDRGRQAHPDVPAPPALRGG